MKSLNLALDKWKNFRLTEVSQSNPIMGQRTWLAHLTLGEALWDLGRYQEAYASFLEAMSGLPGHHDKWPRILNNTIALAIWLKQ